MFTSIQLLTTCVVLRHQGKHFNFMWLVLVKMDLPIAKYEHIVYLEIYIIYNFCDRFLFFWQQYCPLLEAALNFNRHNKMWNRFHHILLIFARVSCYYTNNIRQNAKHEAIIWFDMGQSLSKIEDDIRFVNVI